MRRGQRAMIFKLAGHLSVLHGLLFELRVRLSAVFVRGDRCEERERVARESARSAGSDSGALGVSVHCDGHS